MPPLLGLLFTVTACAEWAWVRPDTTAQQLEQDREDCRLRASALARNRYDSERWLFGADRADIERYHSERSRIETERGIYEQRALRRCMEERGYQLVERPV